MVRISIEESISKLSGGLCFSGKSSIDSRKFQIVEILEKGKYNVSLRTDGENRDGGSGG